MDSVWIFFLSGDDEDEIAINFEQKRQTNFDDDSSQENSDDSTDGDEDEDDSELEDGSHGDVTLLTTFSEDKPGSEVDEDVALQTKDEERHHTVKSFRKLHK